MESRKYLIWLSLACTPGATTFAKLLAKYSSPYEIYAAEDYEFEAILGSKDSDLPKLKNKDLAEAEKIDEFCESKGVGILSYFDDRFPDNLRLIKNPPVMLYYRGVLPDFKKGFRLAVVGTRNLSDYGRINAFHLGYDIGSAGATIVSGMAIGIDGVAHAGALAAGAKNIAFLGSGIDVCYPSAHLTLAREIVKNGCIFTEYAPGTKPNGPNFPVRNRLISGISHAVVVVEAPNSSGALITARKAKEQGRPVFAYPGNVGAEGSQATNALIRNGAFLCSAADDIILKYENVACTGLDASKLPLKRNVSMMNVLTEYRVSCTTSSDIIMMNPYERRNNKIEVRTPLPPRTRKALKESAENNSVNPDSTVSDQQAAPINPVVKTDDSGYAEVQQIDKEAIRIYKKIPLDGPISISELEDADTDSVKVMSAIMKLELCNFVSVLPGDRVMRRLK